MKRRIIFVISFVLLAIAISSCSGGPSTNNNESTLFVSGHGEIYLVPDLATINIGTRSEATDVAAALAENNKQAQSITAVLKEKGIDPLDIQTAAFNVYPYQNYNPDGTTSDMKYVVENTVNVKVRELSRLGEILDVVVRNGANQINGITFDVENRSNAEAEARKLAMQDATEKAKELADLAGVQLGKIQNVSVYSNGSALPSFDKGGGYMAPTTNTPISSGQLLITADANLTYFLK